MKKLTKKDKNYETLISSVGILLERARKEVYVKVNEILVKTYWEIGNEIVSYEKSSRKDASYGGKLFENIAKDLRKRYGKCFSRSNVIYMRLFYIKYKEMFDISCTKKSKGFFMYPKSQTVSDQLSWSHYAGDAYGVRA